MTAPETGPLAPAGDAASVAESVAASVAASVAVRPLLSGPPVPARVLVAVPAAVYLQVAGAWGPGEGVLAVLARDAVRVPCGVVLPAPAAQEPLAGIGAGDTALVGGGQVRVGALFLAVTRWWSGAVPVLPPVLAALPTAHLPTLPDGVAAPARALARALRDGEPLGPAAEALLGLGPGLTPAGDDVLAGALVALAACGRAGRRDELAAAVLPRLHRTTTVSAALLRAAAAGYAVPELARLVRSALPGRPDSAALGALLAVGSSSGVALAAGALAVLTAPPAVPTTPSADLLEVS